MHVHPIDILLRGHAFTHSKAVAPSDPYNQPGMVRHGLSDAQCRACPHSLNSLAWHFWHMACSEDEGFSLTARLPRLFDEQGWGDRLGYPRRDAHGMTKDESLQLSRTIDLGAVWDYRDAVGRRTRQIIMQQGFPFWMDALRRDDLDHAVGHKIYSRKGADSVADFLIGRSRESLLSWWAHQHSLIHLGQATTVRHLVLGVGA